MASEDIRDPNAEVAKDQSKLDSEAISKIEQDILEAQKYIEEHQPMVAKYYNAVKFCKSLNVNPWLLANKSKQ
jgi:hypothetical protein